MIFHATARHTHETCFAHKPENQALLRKVMASADELGVKIIGSYADGPGHTIYMIIEADTALQIAQFFSPIIELGDAEIKPVADVAELMQQFEKEAD